MALRVAKPYGILNADKAGEQNTGPYLECVSQEMYITLSTAYRVDAQST